MLARVVDAVNARRIGEKSRFFVEQQRVVLNTVPQGFRNIEKLFGAFVASGMLDIGVVAEIHRLFVHARSHDVPAEPTLTDVVE